MYLGCTVQVTLAHMEQHPAELRSQMRAHSHKLELIRIYYLFKTLSGSSFKVNSSANSRLHPRQKKTTRGHLHLPIYSSNDF